MNFIKLLLLLAVIAAAYFGFLRDRYLSYPINTSVANLEGKILPVQMVGRTDRIIQFRKSGMDRVFTYAIDDLSVVSKAKIAFFPKASYQDPTRGPANSRTSETSELHMQGMEKEMADYNVKMRLLRAKLESMPSNVEKRQVFHEIKLLENKINVLKYKMEVHEAHSL